MTSSLCTSSPWMVTRSGCATSSIAASASRTPKHIPSTSALITFMASPSCSVRDNRRILRSITATLYRRNAFARQRMQTKKSARRETFAQLRCFLRPARPHRIGHDVFEHGDVLDKAASPVGGELDKRLRPVVLDALPDLYDAGLLQELEMPAQITVGERAELL